ncbi:hypothetical protein ACTXT7_016801 [Hymenolepis weldensis]
MSSLVAGMHECVEFTTLTRLIKSHVIEHSGKCGDVGNCQPYCDPKLSTDKHSVSSSGSSSLIRKAKCTSDDNRRGTLTRRYFRTNPVHTVPSFSYNRPSK